MTNNYKTNLILDILKDLGIYSIVNEEKRSMYIENLCKESPKTNVKDFYKINNDLPSIQKNNANDAVGSKNTLLVNSSKIISEIEESLSGAKTLDEVKDILYNFKSCSLAKTATNTVFGVGNANSDILMIGEAPGAEEDLQGEPFVGRSGKLLTKALEVSGILRNRIFTTNSIFWRPPGNRNPTEEEISLCKPFINSIISIIKPKLILTVGKISANMLLQQEVAIGKLRGRWYNKSLGTKSNTIDDIWVRALYHPAYLLRNPTQKKVFWFDLLEILNKVNQLNISI